ncbi:MAG: heterodisulfide reductase subunit A-like protein, partial [Candidatus Bathyarchaeia archaeon]
VFWEVFLKGMDDVEKLVVAGCHPDMQRKMFRDAFEAAGFEKTKHRGVDIRNMTTEQAVEAIKAVL